jgi:hypothetical protein
MRFMGACEQVRVLQSAARGGQWQLGLANLCQSLYYFFFIVTLLIACFAHFQFADMIRCCASLVWSVANAWDS